ncbi:MAG: hypothetical protein AAFV38_04645, partial [Pseudomonadota bacterium]
MSKDTSLNKLVDEARRLRDHLRHVQGQDCADLAIALQPFDMPDTDEKVGSDQIIALNRTFQHAYDGALDSVDGYTLNEVLKGNSPHIRAPSLPGSVVLTVIGIALVLMAFHFSYWLNRTTFVLSEAEQFVKFDHFQSVTKLIELENYFGKTPDPSSPDLEPHLVYLEGIATLKYHYQEEETLPGRMLGLRNTVVPLQQPIKTAWRQICPSETESRLGWLATALCPAQNVTVARASIRPGSVSS